jgi:hypothetical protein
MIQLVISPVLEKSMPALRLLPVTDKTDGLFEIVGAGRVVC